MRGEADDLRRWGDAHRNLTERARARRRRSSPSAGQSGDPVPERHADLQRLGPPSLGGHRPSPAGRVPSPPPPPSISVRLAQERVKWAPSPSPNSVRLVRGEGIHGGTPTLPPSTHSIRLAHRGGEGLEGPTLRTYSYCPTASRAANTWHGSSRALPLSRHSISPSTRPSSIPQQRQLPSARGRVRLRGPRCWRPPRGATR